jgi:hypothetical protein
LQFFIIIDAGVAEGSTEECERSRAVFIVIEGVERSEESDKRSAGRVRGVARGIRGEGVSSAHSEKYKYERARCIWDRKAEGWKKRREKRKEENKRKRVKRRVEDIRAIPLVLNRGICVFVCMKFYSLMMLKSCLTSIHWVL